ncbi:MAG: UvrD-helicase domain-containing protein, partial [Verrucomicrobiota bacterium]
MTLQPFLAASTPLSPGTTLLEASAGTGKTYTLTAIFLRLIVSEKLAVSEILVSTFTDPATRELKDRIRTRLIAAHQAFSENKATDEVTEALLSRHAAELPCATRRLSDAIRDLDQAQISTIHGFCQRTLREFALESGQPFSAELRPDLTPQLHTVVGDFLRQTMFTATPTAALLLGPPDFEDLLNLLSLTLNKPSMELEVPADTPQLSEALRQLSAAQSQLRALWQRNGETISRLLMENGDWTRKNGAASPSKIAPLLANLAEWLCADAPEAECLAFQNTGGLDAIAVLQQSQLNTAASTKKTAPQHEFFSAIESFVRCARQLSHAFYLTFLQVAPAAFRTLKQQQNLLGFNDLLDELRNALLREGGAALRQNLRKRFRAALLDEFQDTDLIQDEIFSTLFPSQQETGAPPRWLFLIGDPKQAIYSFRGADIHTYIAARNRAHHHYSLGTNYRSEARLVHAVNHLFERHDRPFVLDSIPFAPVAPTAIPPLLSAEGQPLPAFNLWVHTDEKPLKAAESASQLIESVASTIARLLNSGVTIEGLKIWGSPYSPRFFDWAFNCDRGEDIAQHWRLIPDDTDILITHGPPAGILDRTIQGDVTGCE